MNRESTQSPEELALEYAKSQGGYFPKDGAGYTVRYDAYLAGFQKAEALLSEKLRSAEGALLLYMAAEESVTLSAHGVAANYFAKHGKGGG